jgi:hypothetical protein
LYWPIKQKPLYFFLNEKEEGKRKERVKERGKGEGGDEGGREVGGGGSEPETIACWRPSGVSGKVQSVSTITSGEGTGVHTFHFWGRVERACAMSAALRNLGELYKIN